MSKIGTNAKPAVIKLAPHSQQDAILATANKYGIIYIAGFEDEEDISDFKTLIPKEEFEAIADMDAPGNRKASGGIKLLFSKSISRNAPCPCGSGKQYKRCCGK